MYNTDLPTRAELPSASQLLRSTLIAALIAVALLVTTVLPAEYGIDPTGIGRALGLTRMGEIKVSLAAEAIADAATPAAPAPAPAPAPAAKTVIEAPPALVAPATTVVTPETGAQSDTTSIDLKPGEAAEIKLSMREGASVTYSWAASGGTLNFDTHGDPVKAAKGFYHGYGKGKNADGDKGTLTAAFDGKHGWFWRNRSATAVKLTLKTEGAYSKLERVL